MRLLKECYLHEVQVGTEFLVDGSWYKKLDTGISHSQVELLTEYYKPDSETYYHEVGDCMYYRNDLVVITEVPD